MKDKLTRILVVEDEKNIRLLYERTLGRMDCIIAMCETVNDALCRMSKENFDIFFIDLRLPDSSGLTIIDKLPELKHRPSKVIVCSGYLDLSLQRYFHSKGIMTLEKPFTMLQIENICKKDVENINMLHKEIRTDNQVDHEQNIALI